MFSPGNIFKAKSAYLLSTDTHKKESFLNKYSPLTLEITITIITIIFLV